MTSGRHTDVHIERVTVRGIALRADEIEMLRRVIETELAARLTAAPVTTLRPTQAAATRPGNTHINWTPGDTSQLGRDIGRAVHSRLGP